jgi:hypothetical protein
MKYLESESAIPSAAVQRVTGTTQRRKEDLTGLQPRRTLE